MPLVPFAPVFAIATGGGNAETKRVNERVSETPMTSNANVLTELMLDRIGAAAYIREQFGIPIEASDLETAAKRANGPQFRKWGRKPLYKRADLRVWALARLGAPVPIRPRRVASSIS